MESSFKKRKICDNKNEEESEEQQMEKFFALVTSIRQAHDRLIINSTNNNNNAVSNPLKEVDNNPTKKKKKNMTPVTLWKPSFQLEDFMDEPQLRNSFPVTMQDSSQISTEIVKKQENVKEGGSLDLRLSL